MSRALRITFTFLSPDKCLISLFMTREVSMWGFCDLFRFTLKEYSSGLAIFPPRVTFLHTFTGTGSMCLFFSCSFRHLAGSSSYCLATASWYAGRIWGCEWGAQCGAHAHVTLRAMIRAVGPDPLLIPLQGQKLPHAPLALQLTFNHSTVQVPEVTFSTINRQ